jgi:starch synthase
VSVAAPALVRVLFVNENIGGHATMHLGLRHALIDHPNVDAGFVDVPAPGILRRLFRAPIPGLARLDLDLQPLRAQLAKSVWVRRQLRRRHDPIDVLHMYSQNTALLSVGELRRHPSVVSTDVTGMQGATLLPYRAAGRFTHARARLASRLEQRVFDAATIVIGQSEWAAASLRDEYGVGEERLRVIPFGVVVPDVIAEHAHSARPEITWVGNSAARKGGGRLLRVYRKYLRGRCQLNLVTPQRIDEEPGVRVFSGFRPNDGQLARLLARTAVLAFPSEIDAAGYAVLEAMAVGVPVVGFRLHGLPEMVEDGVTGLLVDVDDDQLAAALMRLLVDPDLRLRMGTAARARVLERFDARVTTAALLDAFEDARRRAA